MDQEPSRAEKLAFNASRERRLDFLSPSRVLLYGWLVYFVIFFVAPVRVVFPLASGPALYMLTSCVMFLAGCAAYKLWCANRGRTFAAKEWRYRSFFPFVAAVALIGIGLRVYDRFFVRGASLADDVLQRREALESTGSNIFSIGAAALFPFCFVVPFVFFLHPRDGKRHRMRLLFSLIIFSLPGLNAVFVGSRSTVLISILLMLAYLLYSGDLRINRRTVFTTGLGTVVLLFLFTSVFLNRIELMGLAPESSVYNSGYAFTVRPNSWIAKEIDRPNSLLASNTYFTYLNLTQYAIHGLFEFSYLYQNFRGIHTMGADTFSVYYKLVAYLSGLPYYQDEVYAAEPEPGVFTTFFGPLYVDFGWFGPILMIGFGLAAQALWRKVKQGDIALAPFYFYLVIVIFLAPVVNLLSNGEGLIILTSFILFYLSARIACSRNRLA